MSVIIKEGREKILKILEADTRYRTFEQSLNSRDFCLICGKGRSVDNSSGMPYELIRHHVQYFPALICYVHYLCHRKIHDIPLNTFIQYQEGDARKFYAKKSTMLKQNYERI